MIAPLACSLLLTAPSPAPVEQFLPGGTISTYDSSLRALPAADLDGDGDLDVLVAGVNGITWFENLDGLGTFGAGVVLLAPDSVAGSVAPVDLDGDGDLDLLVGSTVGWIENLDGLAHFGPLQPVPGGVTGATTLEAADLDEDGDSDILATVGYLPRWIENTDGMGGFGTSSAIETRGFPLGIASCDPDGDGDRDVLWGAMFTGDIGWTKNAGGGAFGAALTIGSTGSLDTFASAADADGDGDEDMLYAHFAESGWIKNLDGAGTFGAMQAVESSGSILFGAKLDGDGDTDLLGGGTDWAENLGPGQFSGWQPIADVPNPRDITAADFDGDGDPDVLAGSPYKIAWSRSHHAAAAFEQETLLAHGFYNFAKAFVVDLDGDADPDVLALGDENVAAGTDDLVWFRNLSGTGDYKAQAVIFSASPGEHARDVIAQDLDGDGDQDVLCASNERIVWLANAGDGSFAAELPVATGLSSGRAIHAGDVDGDGDRDVLGGALSKLAWYENADGLGTFGPEHLVADAGAGAVRVADLDSDGDGDFLAAMDSADRVFWYANADGLGTPGPEMTIDAAADSVAAVLEADLDADGDLDVLAAPITAVKWYPNADGLGTFAPGQVIAAISSSGARPSLADLDADGDLDVAFNEYEHDGRVAWSENLGGAAAFGPADEIALGQSPQSTHTADVDVDGDADVVSTWQSANKIQWTENTLAMTLFTSYAPDPVPALVPFKSENVTLYGTRLAEVDDLRVNGVSLNPVLDTWTVVSSTEITMEMPLLDALGPATVEVRAPGGEYVGIPVEIAAPDPPVLQMQGGASMPYLYGGTVAAVRAGGFPGDVAVLTASLSPLPSVLPGLVALDLGAGFTALVNVGSKLVESKGWTQFDVPVPGTLPILTVAYFQAVVFDPSAPVLPLATTNLLSCWVLP